MGRLATRFLDSMFLPPLIARSQLDARTHPPFLFPPLSKKHRPPMFSPCSFLPPSSHTGSPLLSSGSRGMDLFLPERRWGALVRVSISFSLLNSLIFCPSFLDRQHLLFSPGILTTRSDLTRAKHYVSFLIPSRGMKP